MQQIGIGTVLEQARRRRGKSIEEASRETCIRADYLRALEDERFESLIGDVYARAFLKNYASYLELDADDVVSAYSSQFGGRPASPATSAVRRRRTRSRRRFRRSGRVVVPDLDHRPRHLSWGVLGVVAAVLLVSLGLVGLLSRSRSTPAAVGAVDHRARIPALPPPVDVGVHAIHPVRISVRADGGPALTYALREDESRSFEASARIQVTLDPGGLAALTVNGFSLGSPGTPDAPYSASFTPESFRSTPSTSGP